MAFDTEIDIPNPDDRSSFAMAVRAHIDETHDAIFGALPKPLLCHSCSKRTAVTMLHHPMLFMEVEPPRVEDILSPVCCRASCSMQLHQEIELALAQRAAFDSTRNTVGEVLLCCESCAKSGTADEPLLQCSRCKTARYCSPACQRAHWPKHKLACQRD